LPGIIAQPTACVAVFEKRPFWGPELQRRLATRRVLVRECRTTGDLIPATSGYGAAVILLDVTSAPTDCLTWLGWQFREPQRRPVIAAAASELVELEWTLREVGAIAFVDESTPGCDIARLCLRQLRLA
jgi:hypothetical protein